MTGFGRAVEKARLGEAAVEVKSVNQRFLKLDVRMPGKLSRMESRIREAVKAAVARGAVEVFVGVLRPAVAAAYALDEDLVRRYVRQWRTVQKKLRLPGDVRIDALASMPEFFAGAAAEPDDESLEKAVARALDRALAAFDRMRLREGRTLAADIQRRLGTLRKVCERIRRRAPRALAQARKRLKAKLADAFTQKSPAGVPDAVAREAVILADRMDLSEEITRLGSHLDQMTRDLRRGGEVGKRLDFLTQELLREINTIGAKANDRALTELVVDAKVEIEKVREQVQNLE